MKGWGPQKTKKLFNIQLYHVGCTTTISAVSKKATYIADSNDDGQTTTISDVHVSNDAGHATTIIITVESNDEDHIATNTDASIDAFHATTITAVSNNDHTATITAVSIDEV